MSHLTSGIELSLQRIAKFYPKDSMLAEMLHHIKVDLERIEKVVALQEEIIDDLRSSPSAGILGADTLPAPGDEFEDDIAHSI